MATTVPELLLDIDPNGAGTDLVIEGGDLKLDHGLRTLILCSLFSDARAPEGLLPDSSENQNPRGYWADRPGARYGSLLWLHDREAVTPELASDVGRRAQDALQWLVDRGIARSVTVAASITAPDRIDLEVAIARGSVARFQSLWDAELAPVELNGARVRILTR